MSSQGIMSSKKTNNNPGLCLIKGHSADGKQFDLTATRGKEQCVAFVLNQSILSSKKYRTLTTYTFYVDNQGFIRRQIGQLFFQFQRQILPNFWCG